MFFFCQIITKNHRTIMTWNDANLFSGLTGHICPYTHVHTPVRAGISGLNPTLCNPILRCDFNWFQINYSKPKFLKNSNFFSDFEKMDIDGNGSSSGKLKLLGQQEIIPSPLYQHLLQLPRAAASPHQDLKWPWV